MTSKNISIYPIPNPQTNNRNEGISTKSGAKRIPKVIRVGPNPCPSLKEVTIKHIVSKSDPPTNHKALDVLHKEIIRSAEIVCSTLSTAGSSLFSVSKTQFDTVIIDEASQAIEPSTLIALQHRCQRLVLLGDPTQLSPVVISPISKLLGYSISLFERLQSVKYPQTLLRAQYRMRPAISRLISEQFYGGRICDAAEMSSAGPGLFESKCGRLFPLKWFETRGAERIMDSSLVNDSEVLLVKYVVDFLFTGPAKKIKKRRGRRAKSQITWPDFTSKYSNQDMDLSKIGDEWKGKVGVIAPYSAQISELNKALKEYVDKELVEIRTIDGFQGREKGIFT